MRCFQLSLRYLFALLYIHHDTKGKCLKKKFVYLITLIQVHTLSSWKEGVVLVVVVEGNFMAKGSNLKRVL